MMDYPCTRRNMTAVSWRRLMTGWAIRIPNAAFTRRRIVACRDVKMGITMLMELRTAIIIFPAAILPIFLTLLILLIVIPASFSSLF